MIPSSQPDPGGRAAPADTGRARPPFSLSRGRFLAVAAVLLAVTAVFRITIFTYVPVIAKDGVGYCWNARALGREGAAALLREDFNQHPLFPLAILGVERILTGLGATDSPDTWQRAGQAVAFASGLAGVGLIGWLAHRVIRGLAIHRCPRRVSLWAMAIAGLLPLNTALAVDVLSEPLFFVPYLLGALVIVDWRFERRAVLIALIVGLYTGLAFLVRPEGAAIGLATAVVLARQMRRIGIRRVAAGGAALAAGFLICALPYWTALGKLSPKAEKQEIHEFRPTQGMNGGGSSGLLLAATEYEVYNVGTAVVEASRETFKAGRIVVVALALVALVAWRRRLLELPLIGILTVVAVHFALCVFLLLRHGYLDQRHTLAIVLLLIPAAAATLDWIFVTVRERRQAGVVPGGPVSDRSLLEGSAYTSKDRSETGPPFHTSRTALACLVVAAVLSPLAAYSLRVPHRDEGHLREAAAEIVAEAAHEHAPTWVTGRPPGLILGGSSIRRVAFYADAIYAGYFENAPTIVERFDDLRWRLVADPPVADWFAIEAAAGSHDQSTELEANRALLDRLFADPETAAALANRLPPMDMTDGATLHIFRLTGRSSPQPPAVENGGDR